MKNKIWLLLCVLAVSLSSCKVIGGIFKTGFWSGIILVFGVLFLIMYLVVKARKD